MTEREQSLRDMAAEIVFASDDPSFPIAARVAYFVETYEEFSGEPLPVWFDDEAEAELIEEVARAEA